MAPFYSTLLHLRSKDPALSADAAYKKIPTANDEAIFAYTRQKAPPYINSTYQWYKDQVLIPGATAETYTVPDKPEAAGNYVVNVGRPYNTCLNSLPFAVNFSSLNNFTLGNDTLLCSPASITLNAKTTDATSYLWQNGSTDETQQVDTSGLYWVQLTDDYGCIKKDSINIKVQGCENCRLFIPSAFTPNNDGANISWRRKFNSGCYPFIISFYGNFSQLHPARTIG